MTKKIAVFSNGQQDEYKGRRDVKAAWQLTLPNGGTVSGHSYDRASAEKTARSHISQNSPAHYPHARGLRTCHYAMYWEKIARKQGKTVKQLVAEGRAENEAFAAKCKIEIIDL